MFAEMDAIRERYSSDAAACRGAIPQRFSDLDAYMKSLSIDPSALSRTFALTPSETGPVPMNAAVAAALERTQVNSANLRTHYSCSYFHLSLVSKSPVGLLSSSNILIVGSCKYPFLCPSLHLSLTLPPCTSLIRLLNLQAELYEAINTFGILQTWLTTSIPSVEDGNNFGVGIVMEAIKVVAEHKKALAEELKGIPDYFKERAGAVEKLSPKVTNSSSESSSTDSSKETKGTEAEVATAKSGSGTSSKKDSSFSPPCPDAVSVGSNCSFH